MIITHTAYTITGIWLKNLPRHFNMDNLKPGEALIAVSCIDNKMYQHELFEELLAEYNIAKTHIKRFQQGTMAIVTEEQAAIIKLSLK